MISPTQDKKCHSTHTTLLLQTLRWIFSKELIYSKSEMAESVALMLDFLKEVWFSWPWWSTSVWHLRKILQVKFLDFVEAGKLSWLQKQCSPLRQYSLVLIDCFPSHVSNDIFICLMFLELMQVLGTPTREEIKCMNPNYTEFKFPQIKPHPWHKVIFFFVCPCKNK